MQGYGVYSDGGNLLMSGGPIFLSLFVGHDGDFLRVFFPFGRFGRKASTIGL
jgi:hypothetical protein